MTIKEMKMMQSIKDDEFETPDNLIQELCKKYDFAFDVDAAANAENTKADWYYTNALFEEWNDKGIGIWCNPPHTKTLKFIEKAELQYLKHPLNIMMICPANVLSTLIWHKYIEGKREYHAIRGRPVFLKNGKSTKHHSRNAYVVIIWRR